MVIDDNIQELTGQSGKYVRPADTDLQNAAERYITEELSLTAEQVQSIKSNLSADYPGAALDLR